MKRTYVLGVIVIAGAVAAAAANLTALQAPPGGQGGQGRGGGEGREGRGGPGGGGVGKIEKVANNLYMIPGAGGNTAAYVAVEGVVLVDTKLANNGQAILDQVRSVTQKPIIYIVNTHTHGDHNGSNQFFPIGVEIVAHENTEANMQKMPVFQEAANKHGLPDRTYKTRFSLLRGEDTIDLYYFGPAHTNGDTFVVFRNARVMHTGDAFANKGQPLIDRNNGGSGVAYPDTIAKAASSIKNVDVIINGHSPTTMTFQDLRNFADFNRRFLAHARASLKAGKTPEEAMKDFKLPETFKDYNLAGGRGGPGGNFGVIFEELKTPPPPTTKK
jgi:glyoxylase-like metal-dependent hydrolase (beta-lactamase superfamily II)